VSVAKPQSTLRCLPELVVHEGIAEIDERVEVLPRRRAAIKRIDARDQRQQRPLHLDLKRLEVVGHRAPIERITSNQCAISLIPASSAVIDSA
jgi:hypothetical protein